MTVRGPGAVKHSMKSSTQVPKLGRTAMGRSPQLGLISSSLPNRRVLLPGANIQQADVCIHLDPIIRRGPVFIGSPSSP